MLSLTRRQLFARGVVAAAVLPLLATTARAQTHQVAIRGMAFVPADIAVVAGDTIIFTNEDAAPHTATAEDGSFDTGRIARGESGQITVASAGTYPFYCAVHPMMKGTITVT